MDQPSAPRILVVDDEAMVLHVVARSLQQAGYQVVTAPDGWEGWREAQNQQFDLVITDHLMPHMSGPQLVKRLRAAHPTLPIILISGNFTDPDTPTGYPEDVPAIYKPFDGEVLVQHVKRLLARSALDDPRL